MKLYNPFKPHIIVNGIEQYIVRVLTKKGWMYLNFHRYYEESNWTLIKNWATRFTSKEEATSIMQKVQTTAAQLLDYEKKSETWRKV